MLTIINQREYSTTTIERLPVGAKFTYNVLEPRVIFIRTKCGFVDLDTGNHYDSSVHKTTYETTLVIRVLNMDLIIKR